MHRQASPTFTVIPGEEDSIPSPPTSSKGTSTMKSSVPSPSSSQPSSSRGQKRRAPGDDLMLEQLKARTEASDDDAPFTGTMRPPSSVSSPRVQMDKAFTPPAKTNGGLVDPREVAHRVRKENARSQQVYGPDERITKKHKAAMGPPPAPPARPEIQTKSSPRAGGESSSSPEGSASPQTPVDELEQDPAVRSDEEDRGSPIPSHKIDRRFRDAQEEMEHMDSVYYSNPLYKNRSPPPRKPTKPKKQPAAQAAFDERTRRGVWLTEALPYPKFSITMTGSSGRDSAAFAVSRDVYDAIFDFILEHSPQS